MNRFGNLLMGLVLALFVCALTQPVYAQRGGCNVQQNVQQTSQAAAIERAQITSVLQAQQPLVLQSRPVTSATATASSGGATLAAPSVAQLRTAGVTGGTCNNCQQQTVLQTQSIPVQVQSIPVTVATVDAVPVNVLTTASTKSRVHPLEAMLERLRAKSNTSVSKSVAITRTSTR